MNHNLFANYILEVDLSSREVVKQGVERQGAACNQSRDFAPDYILNSGSGDLLAAAAPRPAPARSPAPPSPAPARARAAVEGGSTATVAGRVTRGAARERGWDTTRCYVSIIRTVQCPLTARKPSTKSGYIRWP